MKCDCWLHSREDQLQALFKAQWKWKLRLKDLSNSMGCCLENFRRGHICKQCHGRIQLKKKARLDWWQGQTIVGSRADTSDLVAKTPRNDSVEFVEFPHIKSTDTHQITIRMAKAMLVSPSLGYELISVSSIMIVECKICVLVRRTRTSPWSAS
jgi:hypothetical protein